LIAESTPFDHEHRAHQTLDGLALRESVTIIAVRAPEDRLEWASWLEEIGFVAGESVTLLARAAPGGDPLMVRVGASTFALQRAEAACIVVRPAR